MSSSEPIPSDCFPPLGDGSSSDPDDPENLLATLVKIAEALDIFDISFHSYSTAINDLSDEDFSLGQRLRALKKLRMEMIHYLASAKHELSLIKKWNTVLVPGPSNELGLDLASTLERQKEALVRRSKEAHRELQTLLTEDPLEIRCSVEHVLKLKAKNQEKLEELKVMRAKIQAFQGLPANLDLAKHELRQAQKEQVQLARLRERLLANMARSVT